MKFFSAYDLPPRTRLDCGCDLITKQSFRDECDINLIMARYVKTGILPVDDHAAEPQYGDAPVIDFQTALNYVLDSQRSFDALPASTRKFFENDPANFVSFCSDSANHDAMVELGLADPLPPVDSPAAFSPVDPPAVPTVVPLSPVSPAI